MTVSLNWRLTDFLHQGHEFLFTGRFSMPLVVIVLKRFASAALYCIGNDYSYPIGSLDKLTPQSIDIVTVYLGNLAAEAFEMRAGIAYLKPPRVGHVVVINNREVEQLQVLRNHDRFPYGPLVRLTVSDEGEYPPVG